MLSFTLPQIHIFLFIPHPLFFMGIYTIDLQKIYLNFSNIFYGVVAWLANKWNSRISGIRF